MKNNLNVLKNIFIAFTSLFLTYLIGIFGYMIIEKWSFEDAVYMVTITLTTTGYGEVHPLSDAGRLFTIFLLIGGSGILVYAVSTIITFFLEGGWHVIIRRYRMNKEISNLKNHYIICGGKNQARHVITEFVKVKQKFVVIEEDEEVANELEKNDILVINDNPSEEEVLEKANIKEAIGLISMLETDKDNLFVVITARQMNHDMRIVCNAYQKESIKKLKKAGANAVVSTDFIGGMRVASEMLRPTVVSFMDEMLRFEIPLRIEEIHVPENSPYLYSQLKDLQIPKRVGILILAVKDHATKNYIYNPSPDLIIKPKDILIAIGTPEQKEKLINLFHGKD